MREEEEVIGSGVLGASHWLVRCWEEVEEHFSWDPRAWTYYDIRWTCTQWISPRDGLDAQTHTLETSFTTTDQ